HGDRSVLASTRQPHTTLPFRAGHARLQLCSLALLVIRGSVALGHGVTMWFLSFFGQSSAVRVHRQSIVRCRIQKCRRPPSVSLGGLQRRLANRAELPPIFHLQDRFRAFAAIASTDGIDARKSWRPLVPPEVARQPFRLRGRPMCLSYLEG